MRSKHESAIWLMLASLAAVAPSALAESEPWEDPNTPKLEIRQYRFGRHANEDRLVLEFDRKDAGSVQPRVTTLRSQSGSETVIQVENALLLGAIPESLIVDSYRRRSRHLGNLTVSMDAPKNGFSIRIGRKGGAHIKASWLRNPARLMISGLGGDDVAYGDRQALSITHRARKPSLSELMCFPASAKVGLTVVFQPRGFAGEELQNIRVNTDGTTSTEHTPAPDAIVCYPKHAQIMAALSFEDRTQGFNRQSQTGQIFAPPAAQPANPGSGSELDLDPGPLSVPPSLGQLPSQQQRAPAQNMPSVAPAANPLTLLPPLNE